MLVGVLCLAAVCFNLSRMEQQMEANLVPEGARSRPSEYNPTNNEPHVTPLTNTSSLAAIIRLKSDDYDYEGMSSSRGVAETSVLDFPAPAG
jgi:hypothetical protein